MNDRISKQDEMLRLIKNSASLAALMPLHLPRVGFAVYLIYVFHIFNLWTADLPKGSWKNFLSQGAIFLSGVAGVILLFFSIDVPWFSVLFCVMLLGQIAILATVSQLRKEIFQCSLRTFRICCWVLTGLNLLVIGAHLYMIAAGHIGFVQGPMALYDFAFWAARLLDIPRLIVGIGIAVETYRFCWEFGRF